MKLCYDYHLHSSFSADSDTPPAAMIERAIALGLKGLCFTEHHDPDCPPDGPAFLLDAKSYFHTLSKLREQYRGQIDVRIGIEFGMHPAHPETLRRLTADFPFDFVIASQHFVDGRDPYYPSFFEGKSEFEAYSGYFSEMLQNIKKYSGFDTLGHLDYVVRYGPNRSRFYSFHTYTDWIDPILRHLIEHGICLEVNTGVMKDGTSQPNPAPDVLARYRALGGELITIGSDAHVPAHLACEFSAIEELLRSAGFRYYTVFQERRPVFLPL